MKFKSLKDKLSIIISAILLIVFVIIWAYFSTVIKQQNNKLSILYLKSAYSEYASLIKKEIERVKSSNEVLALIIAKTKKQNNLQNISNILKPIINNNTGIYRITFAYFDNNKTINNKTVLNTSYINIVKTTKGTVEDYQSPEDFLKLETFKKELSKFEKSIVFEVQTHSPTAYIPILTPVFSGRKYIGYIETCISTDWINEEMMLHPSDISNISNVYLSADNKIIASNTKELIIGDPLNTICAQCLKKENNQFNSNKFSYCNYLLPDENYAGNLKLCIVTATNELYTKFDYNSWKYFLFIFILLIIGTSIIYLITGYILSPFKSLIDFAKKVALGNFEPEQKDFIIKQEDETGQLQQALRDISNSLKETTEVSKAIASGNFSKTLKVKSPNDFLAKAINQMSDVLKIKKEKDEEARKEEEKQRWINKGLSLISDVLKRNQDDTKNLANMLIKTLVDFLDISLGGVYMKVLENNDEDVYKLTAAYAYSEQRYIDRKFKAGESLVGSCVSEQRMIYMSSIPEGYITVLSGIGESVPKSLILIPLIYNNEVFGVLELASLREFSKKEQDFLQNAADNIASTLSLTQISSQTTELLEKTRKQAKELEIRDKEMKSTLKKISELQEKTAKKEAEMRAKITALNNSLLIVEYTVDGVLFDANDKFLNTMGYSLKELKGRNVFDMLTEAERKELLHIIDTVKQGNFYETFVRRHTKHEKEKWLIATYTPVLNDKGETVSILFFATDITRIIRKEQSLFTLISGLKEEINALVKDKYNLENKLKDKNDKIATLINDHTLRENKLIQKMTEQQEKDKEKINAYEKMINEIIEQWEIHINNAEKFMHKK